MKSATRDVSLDLMRSVGMLIILVAHGDAPRWLIQLLSFAVVLLIVTSGMSHRLLLERTPQEALPFLRRRLTRIFVPAWLFLGVYLGGTWVTCELIDAPFPWDRATLVDTALFGHGYGYVWIFRIYGILALATMPILALGRRVRSVRVWCLGILSVVLAMELITPRVMALALPPAAEEWMQLVVLAAPAYVALFAWGLRIHECSRALLGASAAVALGLFAACVLPEVLGGSDITGPRAHKYPPTLYYVSYGMLGSALMILARHPLSQLAPRGPLIWFSRNSMWVYLWHIPLAHHLDALDVSLGTSLPWPLRGVLLLSSGVLGTCLQFAVVRSALGLWPSGPMRRTASLLGVHGPAPPALLDVEIPRAARSADPARSAPGGALERGPDGDRLHPVGSGARSAAPPAEIPAEPPAEPPAGTPAPAGTRGRGADGTSPPDRESHHDPAPGTARRP